MPTHTPSDDLLSELALVNVLDPDEAEAARAEARRAGTVADDESLADFLVERGVLTRFQADRAMAGEADQLTAGPYRLLDPLGSGGLGTVYRAESRPDRKPHAVKVLSSRARWNLLRSMEQLAAFGGQAPHPAVVPFTDIGDDDGDYYLAWPFISGESVERHVERNGPPEPIRVARMVADVADGLAACHQQGVSHGLVKPSNLMITKAGSVQVLELGVGAILADNVSDAASLADDRPTGAWLDCAAPEVLADPTRLTPAGDAYSLGCVLYFLLTGKYPFPYDTPAEKMAAHRSRSPVPIRSLRPEVPLGLAELVSRLIRKNPADRPTDLAAVRTALLAVQEPEPEPVPLKLSRSEPRPATPPLPPDLPGRRSTVQAIRPETIPELNRPAKPPEPTPRPAVDVPPTPSKTSFWRRVTRSVVPWGGPPEPIQATVYGPRRLIHGATTQFLVVTHRPELFDRLRTLSMEHLPGSELLAASYTAEPVPKGSEVWVHLALSGAGAVVAPPLAKFPWANESNVTTFNVSVPSWEKLVEKSAASVTIGLNGYEAALMQFELAIQSASRAED